MNNINLINKAIEYIQANPAATLTLEDIANNAGFSLSYFNAMFAQHTGYTPVEYARIYKLTQIAEFLLSVMLKTLIILFTRMIIPIIQNFIAM